MSVPQWVEPLLCTTFFTTCSTHRDAARSECNMYCLDCNGGDAICFYCHSSRHKDHQVLQIRRSSYHDVVRASEIQKVLDISGVQTYVINSARVIFLNERPQPKSGNRIAHACEVCRRSLLDPFRFCSLGCKIAGMKGNGDDPRNFAVEAKNDEQTIGKVREGKSSRRVLTREREESHESSRRDKYPPKSLPLIPSSARRRKGIPHRAPFGS
ncbi:protein RGF1 INDUCIBLE TRANSCRIPTION FACTOR 1-like [Rhodamnia argentea]|uniref:Protein RGF1 INDUCIBLE TRANSCRIPTION FACTOR 1-like n=1 Tax=Rhodamnia argentea TaxID=178133 RepID=A0A8B8NJA2_9MYRT|nr:protein RGF1 INDUCIBLE TRANSCRIPTION FACTOR 1-like [Rhodamnia argentea]